MARTRSKKVIEIKERVQTRLREGVYRPGDRFLSTRELAATFEISYQTAHNLMEELCREGWLERRAASGTYIPGGHSELAGVQLLFSPRARRPHSFGARLLADLTRRLERDRVHWEVSWSDETVILDSDCFPVLWEAPNVLGQCLTKQRAALLLNDRPPPGIDATFLDSVSIDDFSGGVCAAQLLRRNLTDAALATARFTVLTGPENDGRSQTRRDGFLSLATKATVICAGSWYCEDGLRVAGQAVRQGQDGLFCCNDRLAEAVHLYCQRLQIPCPRLVGFDDAPVAEQLNLTTIAIPWEEMIADAADIIKRRLTGDTTAARQSIVTPHPIIRR